MTSVAEVVQKIDDGETLMAWAVQAENAERYEDMCAIMKRYMTVTTEVTTKKKKADPNWDPSKGTDAEVTAYNQNRADARNKLSVAYKNVVGAKRASWRTLKSTCDGLEAEAKESDLPKDHLMLFKKLVEDSLRATCKEVIDILTPLSVAEEEDPETAVFYCKMLGDYYRYMSEFDPSEENKAHTEKHYKDAMEKATTHMQETNPTRLGLALNFSVCYYEILKKPDEACKLAKKAFDAAIEKLDTLNDTSYKDSTLIMQLLRDNLTLWTSEQTDQPEVDAPKANP